jgi:AraC-like DNA-binding protein
MNEGHRPSGYLNEQYRLFHLKDQKELTFDYHFHDFNKIIILLKGNVTYHIEGATYYLKPYDILLVGHHMIHRPVIDASEEYERIVIWIRSDLSGMHCDHPEILNDCFLHAKEQHNCLLRPGRAGKEQLLYLIGELENALCEPLFGSTLLANTYFIQFQIYLNRMLLEGNDNRSADAVTSDLQIQQILSYIQKNLTKQLSNDSIAQTFYMSKFHLMHRFKEETGYTLHHYIRQKRLLYAAELMQQGMSATKACTTCGFSDYSTFLRAFKKTFGSAPTQIKKLPFPSRDSSF